MKLFSKLTGNRGGAVRRAAAKEAAIKDAANGALARYGKTFKDLARYDRGERISGTVSR